MNTGDPFCNVQRKTIGATTMNHRYPYTHKTDKRNRSKMVEFIRSFDQRSPSGSRAVCIKLYALNLTPEQQDRAYQLLNDPYHIVWELIAIAIEKHNQTNKSQVYIDGRSNGWLVAGFSNDNPNYLDIEDLRYLCRQLESLLCLADSLRETFVIYLNTQ